METIDSFLIETDQWIRTDRTPQQAEALKQRYRSQDFETRKRVAAAVINQIGESMQINDTAGITEKLMIARTIDVATLAYETPEQQQQAQIQLDTIAKLYPQPTKSEELVVIDEGYPDKPEVEPLPVEPIASRSRKHRGIGRRKAITATTAAVIALAAGGATLLSAARSAAEEEAETPPPSPNSLQPPEEPIKPLATSTSTATPAPLSPASSPASSPSASPTLTTVSSPEALVISSAPETEVIAPVPSPTNTLTPTAEPIPPKIEPANAGEKIKVPEKARTYYEELLKPLLEAIGQRRQYKIENDPEYLSRIDEELNQDRINFVLYSYGDTHEPPDTERATIGSYTVISFNTRTGRVDTVSWTHDIRAPEIERALREQGEQNVGPQKIDTAYSVGGTDLVEKVVEDISGLSADLVLAFPDELLAEAVDTIFGTLQVEVPKDFDVHPYYFKDTKYPQEHFSKGKMAMDGQKAIQFIKTVPVDDEDPVIEHNKRKAEVIEAVAVHTAWNFFDDNYWNTLQKYIETIKPNKKMNSNLDITVLEETFKNIRKKLTLWGGISSKLMGRAPTPHIDSQTYICDAKHGDGGVQWITSSNSEITKRDIASGVYQDFATETPINGDPYADDLAKGYYPATRKLVKGRLTQ